MSSNTPRRPSRTTTPRPRKIAGREETPAEQEPTPKAPAAPTSPKAPAAPKHPSSGTPPTPPKRPVAKPPADGGGDGSDRAAGRTSTLLAVLGLLVVVLIAQCGWFVWNSLRDVEVATVATDTAGQGEEREDSIAVPEGRPVVLNQLAVQEGVDAAASAAQIMFARNWKSYDDGVEDALSLMTDSFAEEYRKTTDDVKQEFVAKKTEVQVRVVAQSVVRANDTELEALIFLNQYVFRGEGKDAKSTYTPYRALLTMVHTDDGWLVDGIDTK